MIAYLVLLSIVVLLGLLIHAKWSPTILFTVWAGGLFLLGLTNEKTVLASYSNSALVTLIVLILVSLALERLSMLDRLADALLKGRPAFAVVRFSGMAVLMSAFVNNTAVVAGFLSVVTRQRHLPASKLLIPLSIASILGGVTTLIGTSTNLVVNSFAVNAGLPAIGMFQFSWVGIPVALACTVVLAFSARLLPANESTNNENSQSYFLEARIAPGSPLVGKSIEENHMRRLDGLFLVEIERAGRLISPAGPNEILQEEDVLIFSGEISKVQALQKFPGLEVFGNQADLLLGSNLVEVVISNESELAGQTLRDVDFRTMFDAGVVGIRRGDKRITGQLGRVTLRVGDSLLLAVGPDFVNHRNIDRNFHVLDGTLLRPKLSRYQSMITLCGFGGAIACSAMEVWPLLNGLIALLAVLIATKILSLAELRRRFPFDLLMIIGSALVIAEVLESSGAAKILSDGMRAIFDGYGVMGAFVGVYLITLVLTEMVTNNAAAAFAFPVALSTAKAFDVDPTPFIMAVAYGASAGFLIPSGYQTHLMVYSPGRYRLMDYVRAGLPISIVYSIVVLLLVPVFFPFGGK